MSAVDGQSDSTSGTVSVDLLRYRVSPKALRLLQDARRTADAGDHSGSVQRLEAVLSKYPDAAPWVAPMLGVEYLKLYQLQPALAALERAVALLPKDAISRSNLGLCLVLTGQYDRAVDELRYALLLNGHNAKTAQLLDTLLSARRELLAQNPR